MDTSRKRRRSYSSALRDDQAAATRTRILDGVLAEAASPDSDIAIPAIAKRTKVSVPTIYRHFPTRLDLLRAVVEYADTLSPQPAYDENNLRSMLGSFYRHRREVSTRLGPIAHSPAVWELRKQVTVPRRRDWFDRYITTRAPKLGEPDRGYLLDALIVLVSAMSATAFENYVDRSPDETADCVFWMIEAMFERATRTRSKR